MRDLLGSNHLRRLLPVTGVFCALLGAGIAVPAHAHVTTSSSATAAKSKKHRETPAERRAAARSRAKIRKQAAKDPTLTLNSSFIRRAQSAGSVLPFTIRLRRTYEGGAGDDILALSWDPAATAWPLAGTAPAVSPQSTKLTGSMTYEWDYSADATGYSVLGTVETRTGGGISMTATPFEIATADGPCTTAATLTASAMNLTSAGMRFGTANPFSGEVSGTINLRTAIKTTLTPCTGAPVSAVATTAAADPPLPVAFRGTFTVSPGVTGDGRVRFGLLTVADTAATPQRTTFGLVHACTDPAAVDGCARRAFPVRTKITSLTAEVIAGDAMPPPPAPLF